MHLDKACDGRGGVDLRWKMERTFIFGQETRFDGFDDRRGLAAQNYGIRNRHYVANWNAQMEVFPESADDDDEC